MVGSQIVCLGDVEHAEKCKVLSRSSVDWKRSTGRVPILENLRSGGIDPPSLCELNPRLLSLVEVRYSYGIVLAPQITMTH